MTTEVHEKNKILDWLYGVLASPVNTLNEISKKKPIAWALLIYAGTSFLGFLSNTATVDVRYSIIFVTAGMIVSLVGLFVITGLAYLLSLIFKATGGYWGLFSAIGFAQFPSIFVAPGVLLGEALGAFGGIFSGIIVIGITIWVFVLDIIALRESRNISTIGSIVTYILIFVVLTILIVIPILFLMMMFAPTLTI